MKLMMITQKPEAARHALKCGVDRIFLDLEILGKLERQGHLNTVISRHSLEDLKALRPAVPEGQLLVRTNPLNPKSREELEAILTIGADFLMLPMFRSVAELAEFSRLVEAAGGKSVALIPLVETPQALDQVAEVAKVRGVTEVFIGLNDLHLELKMKFMFEPLANGLLERAVQAIKAQGKAFGFGGISRLGHGDLPADEILAEHVRLGSASVILSRSFFSRDDIDLAGEIGKIRNCIESYRNRSPEQACGQSLRVQQKIREIVRTKAAQP